MFDFIAFGVYRVDLEIDHFELTDSIFWVTLRNHLGTKNNMRIIQPSVATICLLLIAPFAFAVPNLQLGPGATGTWDYDTGSETWIGTGDSFTINAYAKKKWRNGPFSRGNTDKTAYLVFAATPKNTDAPDGEFIIDVNNDGVSLSIFQQGFGTPPYEEDVPHGSQLAPHGIYPTYWYIYEFAFDGSKGTIYNTQPGDSGSAKGWTESFEVTVDGASLADSLTGIHMDLFTVNGA
ncbi:MAG TPA: hypothetical protein DCZ03_11770, partial [Gammaproteobacteria bacterium]|nr:hypothetical protein [Gammaproteobacteria bacterium]